MTDPPRANSPERGKIARRQTPLHWPGEDRRRIADREYVDAQKSVRRISPAVIVTLKVLGLVALGVLTVVLVKMGDGWTTLGAMTGVFLVVGGLMFDVGGRGAVGQADAVASRRWQLRVARRGNLHRSDPEEFAELEALHAEQRRLTEDLARGRLEDTDPAVYGRLREIKEALEAAQGSAPARRWRRGRG